jgi:hypothetical protein
MLQLAVGTNSCFFVISKDKRPEIPFFLRMAEQQEEPQEENN